MDMLEVKNNGREIADTNYWRLLPDKFLFSVNAGALRVLVPWNNTPEMRQVIEDGIKVAVLSIGKDDRYGYERAHLMLDDGGKSPYCIESNLVGFDVVPDKSWDGQAGLECLIYTCGVVDEDSPMLAWRGRLVVRHTRVPNYEPTET